MIYLPEEILKGIRELEGNNINLTEDIKVDEFLIENNFKDTLDWIINNRNSFLDGISMYMAKREGFGLLDNTIILNGINYGSSEYYSHLKLLSYANNEINKCKNKEFNKIPNICKCSALCVRGYLGYSHFCINNRENCPKVCPLYKESEK